MEAGNPSDCFAVAALKQETVVGHVARPFSAAIFTSLFTFSISLSFRQDPGGKFKSFASLWKYVCIDIFTRFFSYVLGRCGHNCGHKCGHWLEFNLACFCNSPICQNFSFANNSRYTVYEKSTDCSL